MPQHRLQKLPTSSPVLAASFGTYTHRCGRPSCRCHHGGPSTAASTSSYCLRRAAGGGLVQAFRWVEQLAYQDSEGRRWHLNALECTEARPRGEAGYFAWLTPLPVGN